MMYFETYLHGFQYFTLKGGKFFIARATFFGTCVALSTCFLLYQTYLNIYAYLQFGVATAASFEHFPYGSKAKAIDFPAITFSPNNMFLADQVGFSQTFDGVPNVVVAFVSETMVYPDSQEVLKQIGQCKSSLRAMRPDMLAMEGLDNFIQLYGPSYMMYSICHNSINSVVDCKWQGRSIKCADLFLNRMTDQGSGFTFYPSTTFVDSYPLLTPEIIASIESPWFQGNVSNCWNQTFNPNASVTPDCKAYVSVAIQAYNAQAWGTSKTQISRYNLSTSSAGPRSGLQLILSVLPEQYCVGNTVQNSFGFFALPHARDIGPALVLSPNIEIPAGFVADVAISVTQITRKTESIGKCKSKNDLQWYRDLQSYSYDACLVQCFTLIFNDPQLCNCVPYFAPPYMFTSGQAYSFDSEGNLINRFCTVDQAKPCYMDLLQGMNYSAYAAIPKGYTFIGQFLQSCACPKQCEETQYRTDVSFSPLASPTSFKATLANPNISVPTNLTEFRKSFAVVNFYYKDVQVMQIDETQAIQIMDVFNSVGGSFGLTLGGSFITLGEIVMFFFKLCHGLASRRRQTAPSAQAQ